MKDMTTDLSDLLGWTPPAETANAAPAGPRNGVETKAAHESACPEYSESSAPNQAWAALDAARKWVAWREDHRNGKPTKVPYVTPQRMAKANDPATWLARPQAEAVARDLLSAGQKGGVGLMLGGDGAERLGGVDLDSCVDLLTGQLEPWAAEVVERFASYAEISPSGSGVKVFFSYAAADLDALRAIMGTQHGKSWSRGNHTEIALHLGNRYFTVTGQNLGSAPASIQPVDRATLAWLIEDVGPRFKGDAPKAAPKDESRSGRAFSIAGDCRRAGMGLDGFRAELMKDSDLADWAKDARQVQRAWNRTAGGVEVDASDFDDLPEIDGFPMTEDGVARAFAAAHADRLRFCHSSGRWHVWTGTHWRKEETKLAFNWSREICRARAASDPRSSAAKALTKAATASAVERFAQADRAFAVTAEAWDRDHWIIGTPGGTIDLRTGQLRPALQTDMITKITAAAPIPLDQFNPARDCPRWLAFLDQATGSDTDAIRFMQQWAGYSLTGDTREEALLFVHGPGGSGKSTAVNTIGALLGDYAIAVDTETITAQKHARHSTEIARLHGARMAYASETEAGRAWAENRIKQLTGGDVMTARFMRQDDFIFKPQLKLVIVGNNKPAFSNVDGAIKRRFNVMPFDRKPAAPDFTLKVTLEKEMPGILSWAVLGCLDWQRNGLIRPAVMVETTEAYFEEQDTFANWIADRCIIGQGFAATTESLFDSWSAYARSNEDEPGNKRSDFPQRMKDRGFDPIQSTAGIRGRGWRGLKLTPLRDPFDNLPAPGEEVTQCLTH
ncbi:MAG: phage/plasmid primase, P4 family [Paracoccus sp. (in: a-proteobacteria)]|uniref:phage/plasmid primase, P4 family n=1 Tax=Paracoccus sp. TaxID=267 RepID=UPI0026DF547A|nr:phage/plasmid primase, P4 family [Paracoccus sp. (in: a-proteobacteria)]MDO5633085.1 phage/plasmid primase, P4 family [Paracoccus sp. (in: a-proteobacteria)]